MVTELYVNDGLKPLQVEGCSTCVVDVAGTVLSATLPGNIKVQVHLTAADIEKLHASVRMARAIECGLSDD